MFRIGNFSFDHDRPLIMGIVNLTPDSFSGDGLMCSTARAVDHARRQIDEGADILDIGAESSRPGAIPTSLEEELARLLPVLEALGDCGVPLSIDTYKPEVMRAALAVGASMINDIYGLRMPGALEVLASSDCSVCLMHMQGEPLTMQASPVYGDLVAEVREFFMERVSTAEAAGIQPERIVLDPGFGFGKSVEHNVELLRRLPEVGVLELPLLVGMSRKSMLGAITGRPVDQRLAASLGAALLAAQNGARIVRVHDVAATRDVFEMWRTVESLSGSSCAQ